MYKIAKISEEERFSHSEMDPVAGETDVTVKVTTIKKMKKEYPTYLQAITGLDKIKSEGDFIIVKEN
jgi:hypothetical protein